MIILPVILDLDSSSMTSILKMEVTINEKMKKYDTEVPEAVLKVNSVLIGKVVLPNDEVSVP